jgi:hypothetical protein
VIHIPSVLEVPVPAEDVFAYLSDPATNPEWSPNTLEVSDIPDGTTALGTRYRANLKFFGRVNFLIDEFEPGQRVRFNCDPPGGQLLHRFIIEQIPGGTRINHLVEFEPRGLAVLAEPIIGFFTKKMVADLNKQISRRPQQADNESRFGGGRMSVGTPARGGHFAADEAPAEFVAEVRAGIHALTQVSIRDMPVRARREGNWHPGRDLRRPRAMRRLPVVRHAAMSRQSGHHQPAREVSSD